MESSIFIEEQFPIKGKPRPQEVILQPLFPAGETHHICPVQYTLGAIRGIEHIFAGPICGSGGTGKEKVWEIVKEGGAILIYSIAVVQVRLWIRSGQRPFRLSFRCCRCTGGFQDRCRSRLWLGWCR